MKLHKLGVEIVSHCFLTDRSFAGSFANVSEGEEYLAEWACYAEDDKGNKYMVTWMFPAIKGMEPEDDQWPFDDESFVDDVYLWWPA